AEHAQRVRADEAGLQPAQAPGAAPQPGGHAVDQPVPAAGVEVDQRAGEPDAGPGDERLVDRVRVEVATRGANRERDVRGLLDRDAVAPDSPPRDPPLERGEM